MRGKRNSTRKYFFAVSAFLVLVLGVFAVSAAFSGSLPWHPLQQVSTNATSGISVDVNDNGIIDNADKVGGLSAADLRASSTGGSGQGFMFSVVIVGADSDTYCPAGFTKKTLGELAGWNDYFYVAVTDYNLFMGGLYSWDTYNNGAGGTNGHMDTRTPAAWGGNVCWKTYSVNTNNPPRVEVFAVDQSVDCTSFGDGFYTFEVNEGSGNGYTSAYAAPFALVVGEFDWADRWSTDESIMRQWYHYTHVGKTCWKVSNLS